MGTISSISFSYSPCFVLHDAASWRARTHKRRCIEKLLANETVSMNCIFSNWSTLLPFKRLKMTWICTLYTPFRRHNKAYKQTNTLHWIALHAITSIMIFVEHRICTMKFAIRFGFFFNNNIDFGPNFRDFWFPPSIGSVDYLQWIAVSVTADAQFRNFHWIMLCTWR